jgi:hypothetical protein
MPRVPPVYTTRMRGEDAAIKPMSQFK